MRKLKALTLFFLLSTVIQAGFSHVHDSDGLKSFKGEAIFSQKGCSICEGLAIFSGADVTPTLFSAFNFTSEKNIVVASQPFSSRTICSFDSRAPPAKI